MTTVIKRDGSSEPLDLNKIHRVLEWATEGLYNVSVSDIELASNLRFYDEITSEKIHVALTKAAADLITAETPDYQYVASRLMNFQLRKEVYGQFDPPNFLDHVTRVTELGFYDPLLLQRYTPREFKQLGEYIKHERDFNMAYAGMSQMRGKYLVRNRTTGEYFETPQFALMLIAMTLFSKYKTDRLNWVKELYDNLSTFKVSFATPIMAGARTPVRQFSSCTVMEVGDSLESISATIGAIIKYVSNKAGIGLGAGAIRAVGSSIRNGDASHTGNTRFYKLFEAATLSCSQGGVRGGAATVHFPFWHKEFGNLIVLKNNKGIEENRVRQLDYSVQFSRLAYERLLAGGDISLFCPNEVPGLYDAFFEDEDKFQRIYTAAEANPSIPRKTISAQELFETFMTERKNTGRVYFMNVDHCNTHSSFVHNVAPVRTSNLCVTGDTKIDIEGIGLIPIQDCCVGMKVKSRNILSGTDEYKLIKDFAQTGRNRQVLKLNGELKCTPEHEVYTVNRGYVQACELVEWEDVVIYQGNTLSLHSLVYLEETYNVFDITVEDNENFYGDGILVHNCQEITLPTSPINNILDDEGEISLCILAAINMGEINSPADFERPARILVRALNALIDNQEYPVLAAELSTLRRRPLGVGIINLAYWIAKNKGNYSNPDLELHHRYAEAYSYWLIRESVNMAMEFGACPASDQTKYDYAILPIDTYKKAVDELVAPTYTEDWETLREDLVDYGIFNSTLMAGMPSETSSQIANGTNGFEPPRGLVSVKGSKDSTHAQVVPEVGKVEYELLWDQPNPTGYLKICAVWQKFMDQAISVNFSYNPAFYEDSEVPMSELIQHMLLHYKWGGKTGYYINTNDEAGEADDCDSCKI